MSIAASGCRMMIWVLIKTLLASSDERVYSPASSPVIEYWLPSIFVTASKTTGVSPEILAISKSYGAVPPVTYTPSSPEKAP